MRLDLSLEVEYKLSGRDKPAKKALSRNISLGGIKLLMDEELAAGTRLDLAVKNTNHNKSCLVKAEVVWVQACDEKAGSFEAGLKFIEMNINELSGLISSLAALASRSRGSRGPAIAQGERDEIRNTKYEIRFYLGLN